MRRTRLVLPVFLAFLIIGAPPAYANPVSGLVKIAAGIFRPIAGILAGTFGGPPIVGTLVGAVNGTVQGVGLVASGVTELAFDGVSLAKSFAPYLLPFVL